jgi:hypothetical protein
MTTTSKFTIDTAIEKIQELIASVKERNILVDCPHNVQLALEEKGYTYDHLWLDGWGNVVLIYSFYPQLTICSLPFMLKINYDEFVLQKHIQHSTLVTIDYAYENIHDLVRKHNLISSLSTQARFSAKHLDFTIKV